MGALVEALQWWRSDEGKLALAMATAALGAEAAAAAGEEGSRGNGNGECSQRGRVLGVLTRVLAYLCRTGQGAGDARPAAGSTWRLCPDTGRPLNTNSVRQSL